MRWPWQPLVDDTGRPGLTLAELLIVFLVGVLAFVTASPALGQMAAPRDVCREAALYAATAAWARTMRADRERVLRDVERRTQHLGQARAAGIARESRRAWHLGLEPDEALQAVFDRCMARLADFGSEG